MARRHFGNIRRLPSGSYQARYTGPDGRQHSKTFKTVSDCNLWLSEQEVEVRRGRWIDPSASEITLSSYIAEWWQTKQSLAPTTSNLYEGFLEKHIEPALGEKRLNSITRGDVKRWHANLLSGEQLSPNTVAKIYRLLKQILASALDDERMGKNPCTIRGAGQEHVPERRVPTLEEVQLVINSTDHRYRTLVALAAFTGLRFGEIAGLQRKHFNPLCRELTVEQQVAYSGGGKLEFRAPKTDAGKRTITLPRTLVSLLTEHSEQLGIVDVDDLLFTAPEGGLLNRRNFTRRIWHPARQRAGVDNLHFHDLRHFAATQAAKSGVPTKALMKQMGHASAKAAQLYQHALSTDAQRIADQIDSLMVEANAMPRAVATD